MVTQLVAKIDGYRQWAFGNVDKENIEWISGWYTFIPNIEGDGTNSFNILYQDGYQLYNQYASPLAGGELAANIPTTESYVCPIKVGAASITWSDINPAGAGIGANYTVDGLFPANICRARKKSIDPYVFTGLDGYSHEMFLLLAYSQGLALHTFFWVYMEPSAGWTRVPGGAAALPLNGELFDIWIPASVNLPQVKWSSGLVQDNDKLLGGSGGGIANLEYTKSETLISLAGEGTGAVLFDQIDITNLIGTNNVMLGFINGFECNVYVGTLATANAGHDFVIDTASAGYPVVTDVYWNGSAAASTVPSTLGDILVGDMVRLYYIVSA